MDKTIKYTKNNKVMAFFTLEDLVGTAEVVVFPRDYEKWQRYLNEEAKLFVQGRVDAGDDRGAKIILEKVRSFEEIPRELWIQFKESGGLWTARSRTSGGSAKISGYQQCGYLSERCKCHEASACRISGTDQ